MIFLHDYIDEDVAYLLGLIAGRGTLNESGGQRQLVIEFPFVNLRVQGITSSFDQDTAITIGLVGIQRRLQDLLGTIIDIVDKSGSKELVARFITNNMIWRNLITLTNGSVMHQTFRIPQILFNPELPMDYKREFVKGYGDVAGNIRASNNYMGKLNRVRLDVLNPNWHLPVEICLLLQNELNVEVQMVQWGHPNTRGSGNPFKEHQVQIFAREYGKIGFNFPHKQKLLEEFMAADARNYPAENARYLGCPGRKLVKKVKPNDLKEHSDLLPTQLKDNHYNAYWQICKDIGCTREPAATGQTAIDFDQSFIEADEVDEIE